MMLNSDVEIEGLQITFTHLPSAKVTSIQELHVSAYRNSSNF